MGEWIVDPSDGAIIEGSGESVNITFTKNGEYTVKYTDGNGHCGTKTVTVDNCSPTPGDITITAPSTLTNECPDDGNFDLTVTSNIDSTDVLQVEFSFDSDKVTFSRDGSTNIQPDIPFDIVNGQTKNIAYHVNSNTTITITAIRGEDTANHTITMKCSSSPSCDNTGTCEIQIVNETQYTYKLSKHSDNSIAVIYVGDTGHYGTRLFPPNNNTITISSNSTYPSSSSFLTVSYNVCGDEPESQCCAKDFKVNLNSCTEGTSREGFRMNKLYEGGTSIYDLNRPDDYRVGYAFIEPVDGTPNYFTPGGKYIITIKEHCS